MGQNGSTKVSVCSHLVEPTDKELMLLVTVLTVLSAPKRELCSTK